MKDRTIYFKDDRILYVVRPGEDRIRYEVHGHLVRMGIEGSVLDPGVLDLDYDYPSLDLDAPTSGITSLGSIRLHGYPISLVNILREKNYEVGRMGFGGDYGPIEFASNGWRLRFFITGYEEFEVPRSANLTEFHLMTNSNIEKRFLGTRIVDFTWQSLGGVDATTRIEDEILNKLKNDLPLHQSVLSELNKIKSITIKSYKPKKDSKRAGAEASHAEILLFGDARKKKELLISRNCFDMFNKIAEYVLLAKKAL